MKVKMDLNTTGTYAQNKPKTLIAEKGELANKTLSKGAEIKELGPKTSPDYKVDLTSTKAPIETTSSSNSTSNSLSSVSTPEPKPLELPKLDLALKEVAKEEVKEKAADEIGKTMFSKDVRDGSIRKPAIIFIKGLDIFSSPSKSERGYAGVGRMAESIEGSRIYGWSQKEEILSEIKKVHQDYPVILVGHSLGGDTAVEVADELDSLENQFRPVDLLITLDAVGFKNDIIPQNVKNHLNIFGERDLFFNDGPHVARNHEKTTVKNILAPDEHTDLDDSKSVQFEVVDLINKTLGKV